MKSAVHFYNKYSIVVNTTRVFPYFPGNEQVGRILNFAADNVIYSIGITLIRFSTLLSFFNSTPV